MLSVIERHRHQLGRYGTSVAALALAATAPVAFAGPATAQQSAPLTWTFGDFDHELANINWGYGAHVPTFGDALVLLVVGVLLLFATLHLVRGLGRMHGLIAKSLLVSRSVN